MQILIVDGSVLVVSRLSDMLKESNDQINISTALSYAEAEQTMSVYPPDLVLLDIQLPERNGIELLSLIKSLYPNVITMVLTNRVSNYYKSLCKTMGADHFIDKSREFEKIPTLIHSYIVDSN